MFQRIATILQEDRKVLSLSHRDAVIGAELYPLMLQVSELKYKDYVIKLLTTLIPIISLYPFILGSVLSS